MRILVTFLLLCLNLCTFSLRKSPGCGKSSPINTGNLVNRNIEVSGQPSRAYTTWVPNSYNINEELPLLLFYHGQYGSGRSDGNGLKYTSYPLISVYLQGLQDGNCGTGWNTGWNGNRNTCIVSEVGNSACCYDSCRQLGYCSGNGRNANCGWSTCFDDVTFTKTLLSSLGDEFCIDLDSVYASGWSNGGMMAHWLTSNLGTTFAAIMPIYGLPLVEINVVPNGLKDTAILSLHPRNDRVIPVEGGNGGGWLYESTDSVLSDWANVHSCNGSPTTITTPYDGGSKNFVCQEYLNCKTGSGRVLRCLYDGGHGSSCPNMEAITWWFWGRGFYNSTNSTSSTYSYEKSIV